MEPQLKKQTKQRLGFPHVPQCGGGICSAECHLVLLLCREFMVLWQILLVIHAAFHLSAI